MHSTILPGFVFSYHAPVVAACEFTSDRPKASRFRMNNSHVVDPAVQSRVIAMWDAEVLQAADSMEALDTTLNRCIKKARKIVRCWGKHRVKDRQAWGHTLRQMLHADQVTLEHNPPDSIAQEALPSASDVVKTFDTDKARWMDQAPLTIEELGVAAATLAKEKVPGPDGVPAELTQAESELTE
ncbi:unnamed protein product [Calypogeia fissa]